MIWFRKLDWFYKNINLIFIIIVNMYIYNKSFMKVYSFQFEIHCRLERYLRWEKWETAAESKRCWHTVRCQVAATKLIVSYKVQLWSLQGPILSGRCCGQCCLLGKHFCSQRVLAHLINRKRFAKYRASNKTKSKYSPSKAQYTLTFSALLTADR